MAQTNSWILEDVTIARPCHATWDGMVGDDRVRLCQSCRKNVFNLSAMTRAEGEALIGQHETPCLRLYRRFDGTVITSDCPVGINDARRPFKWLLLGLGALLAARASISQYPAQAAGPGSAPPIDRVTAMVQGLSERIPWAFMTERTSGTPSRPRRRTGPATGNAPPTSPQY